MLGATEKADAEMRRLAATRNFIVIYFSEVKLMFEFRNCCRNSLECNIFGFCRVVVGKTLKLSLLNLFLHEFSNENQR